jgi:hypothetical protein
VFNRLGIAYRKGEAYSESEQPGCAQSHEISTSPFASSQRWQQNVWLSDTMHRQAGCAHFFCSTVAIMIIYPSYQPGIGTLLRKDSFNPRM